MTRIDCYEERKASIALIEKIDEWVSTHDFQKIDEYLTTLVPEKELSTIATISLRVCFMVKHQLSNWQPLLDKSVAYAKVWCPQRLPLFVGLIPYEDIRAHTTPTAYDGILYAIPQTRYQSDAS